MFSILFIVIICNIDTVLCACMFCVCVCVCVYIYICLYVACSISNRSDDLVYDPLNEK
jgi:hypothetical protein